MSSTDQTINVPQLIFFIVLGAFTIRYFFFSNNANTPAANRGPSSSAASNIRAREADVERIQQMFPQVSRRSIMWDLQRNGGNVVASTERILSGRGLEVPPQSFQPPLPAASTTSASTTSTPAKPKPVQPDLITRYNLQGKLADDASKSAEDSGEEKQRAKQAWSQNKGERQALLQRRREEMILAARRKMEAKVAAEAALGNPGV